MLAKERRKSDINLVRTYGVVGAIVGLVLAFVMYQMVSRQGVDLVIERASTEAELIVSINAATSGNSPSNRMH